MSTKYTLVRGALATVMFSILISGCTDKGTKSTKGSTLSGVVTKIDLATRDVAMTVKRNDGGEQEQRGKLADDTEILINGRGAKLEDVRVGEKVEVTVQKNKTEEGKYDIKKVEITRAADADWKSTGTAPTTPPANPPVTPTEVKPTPTPTPTPPPTNPTPTPPRAEADTKPPTPVSDIGMNPDPEEAKQDLTDLIYAQIRVRMEEALARRELLINEKTPQSDPRVAEFERQIIRARQFLSERGELLDDVTPPLAGLPAPTTPGALFRQRDALRRCLPTRRIAIREA